MVIFIILLVDDFLILNFLNKCGCIDGWINFYVGGFLLFELSFTRFKFVDSFSNSSSMSVKRLVLVLECILMLVLIIVFFFMMVICLNLFFFVCFVIILCDMDTRV